MNANPTAPCLYEMLKRRLLRGVRQDIAGGTEEDDRLVLREIGIVEHRRILGGIDREIVVRSERPNRCNAVRDGIVAEPGRGRENQDFVRGCLRQESPRRTELTGDNDNSEYKNENGWTVTEKITCAAARDLHTSNWVLEAWSELSTLCIFVPSESRFRLCDNPRQK